MNTTSKPKTNPERWFISCSSPTDPVVSSPKIRILAPFVWRERSTIQGVGVLRYRSAWGETCLPKFRLHGAACWACCCRVTIGYTILENERRAGIRKCGKRQKREWTVNSYPTIARALFLSNLAWVLFLVQLSMGASFKCSAKMSAIVRRRVQHLQIPVAVVKTMLRLLTRLTVRIWFERKMVNWICCAKYFVNIYRGMRLSTTLATGAKQPAGPTVPPSNGQWKRTKHCAIPKCNYS